ncbi:hypothetical protein N8940_00480 [Sphingomonadaceae bacterium]|nr:hypothetical protein [Sphingomonadaceae bacterium]
MLFEPDSYFDVSVPAPDMTFVPASVSALATGANRLLIGGEIIQFSCAEQISTSRWRLSGLLRGRGGTERIAQSPHPVGTSAVLIDESLIVLDPALLPSSPTTTISAIGFGDAEPVEAPLANAGTTRRPLTPVHPVICALPDGSLDLRWTRRARGAWEWPDEVETPLVEQAEAYLVGVGPVDAPVLSWQTTKPALTLIAAEMQTLRAGHDGEVIWVRQIGNHAQSHALLLTAIA